MISRVSVRDTMFSGLSRLTVCAKALLVLCIASCAGVVDGNTGKDSPIDYSSLKNESGAIRLHAGASKLLEEIYSVNTSGLANLRKSFVYVSGILTDELMIANTSTSQSPFAQSYLELLDARMLENNEIGTDDEKISLYVSLNKVRNTIRNAREFIVKYAEASSSDLRSDLFLKEALTQIMLAELFCSGIPLSTVDFEKNYTLTRGYTTDEISTVALQYLDSAEKYIEDSTHYIARINLIKARIYVNVGKLSEAYQLTSEIPTDFEYSFKYRGDIGIGKYVVDPLHEIIPDGEGINGIPYVSSNDPRITRQSVHNTDEPLVITSGIEARLIEAEYQLINKDQRWLSTINSLRTSCQSSNNCPTDISAGSGNVPGLLPLSDPVDDAPMEDPQAFDRRLRLILEERAYWFFLTGRRQGDMRRMVKHYKQPQHTVYPVGAYRAGGYGTSTYLPVPDSEKIYNGLYGGCEKEDE